MTSPAPVEGPDLGELARLEAASTPGPWVTFVDPSSGTTSPIGVEDADGKGIAYDVLHPGDPAFIAALRNAAPFLLAQAAAVERVRALCDEYRANCDPTSTQAQVAELFRDTLDGRSE